MADYTHDNIIDFWFSETSEKLWFVKNAKFDQEINDKFGSLHASTSAGEYDHWSETTLGGLALVIVLDQFSRNLFRDSGKAFAQDEKARSIAGGLIENGGDLALSSVERSFLYMTYMHSESLKDQKHCVELYKTLGREDNLEFAIKHMEIIERFGRFPHRNDLLGRQSTEEEIEFLTQPGSSF